MVVIGCSGYNYRDWKGVFYPQNIKGSDMLAFYAEYFNSVEINYTFYHTPKETTLQRWDNIVPDRFLFSLKVPRKITHVHRLKDISLVKDFLHRASILGNKLGVVLFQMPPSFKLSDENIDRIKKLFKVLSDGRFAIEFRHNSWFCDEVADICTKHNIAMCIVSAPNIRFFPVKTSSFAYIRMHGKEKWYDYNYSNYELDEIADLISDLKDVFIYFNNTVRDFAIRNALYLKNKLGV